MLNSCEKKLPGIWVSTGANLAHESGLSSPHIHITLKQLIKLVQWFWFIFGSTWAWARGLQCFKLKWNRTENDRYWKKITLLFAKYLKMQDFFTFELKFAKSANRTPTIFCFKSINMGWFQLPWCRLKLMPLKKAIFLYYFFSWTWQAKNLKTTGACKENTDLIV